MGRGHELAAVPESVERGCDEAAATIMSDSWMAAGGAGGPRTRRYQVPHAGRWSTRAAPTSASRSSADAAPEPLQYDVGRALVPERKRWEAGALTRRLAMSPSRAAARRIERSATV